MKLTPREFCTRLNALAEAMQRHPYAAFRAAVLHQLGPSFNGRAIQATLDKFYAPVWGQVPRTPKTYDGTPDISTCAYCGTPFSLTVSCGCGARRAR